MYMARVDRSVELAKGVAEKLSVDLFDDHRRGRFREIVQNCAICAYQAQCQQKVMDGLPMETTPPHCRNAELFSKNG